MKKIPEIIIRPFEWAKDLSDVLSLRMTKEQERGDFSSTTEHLLREVRRHPEFNSRLFAVCPSKQNDEKVVGVFLIEPLTRPSNRRCVLKGLLIDNLFQHCGIGNQLMQKLPALVSVEFPGSRYLHLAVHKENAVAIKLYEKGGFVKTGRTVPVGPTCRKDIEYVLQIVPDHPALW